MRYITEEYFGSTKPSAKNYFLHQLFWCRYALFLVLNSWDVAYALVVWSVRTEGDRSFLIDTLPRHCIYLGQMVCGALRRTVLLLHQSLRRGGWVPGHGSSGLGPEQCPM